MTRKHDPDRWTGGAGGGARARPRGRRLLKVSAIRFWTYEETTRIAVEISGEFTYHSERLHNPERVFFDIRNARLALRGKKPGITSVEDKLVKRIRIAETQPGVTRIVLDLTGPAEFTASQLANPDRLMIELRKGAAPADPGGLGAAQRILRRLPLPRPHLPRHRPSRRRRSRNRCGPTPPAPALPEPPAGVLGDAQAVAPPPLRRHHAGAKPARPRAAPPTGGAR